MRVTGPFRRRRAAWVLAAADERDHDVTERKTLKRRIRARMSKTGERYTAARRQVLAKSPGTPTESPRAPKSQPPGRRPDELVRARTGRGWDEWFEILTGWGAADRPHREIARWLNAEQGVDGWWSQEVTVGYEQAIGRRVPLQRGAGSFAATATRTIRVPVERLHEAVVDEAVRERWLPGASLRPRPTRAGKAARFDWEDGASRLVFWFEAAGEARSRVALEHERLPDAAAAREMKAFWRERLTELKRLLEG